VLIDRAYAYGQAAAGQAGVEAQPKILRDDVSVAKGGGCMSEQESSSRRAFFKPAHLSLLGAAAMLALGQTSNQ